MKCKLGWYRERCLAPLGAGQRIIFIPLNPPSKGDPKGWPPSGHPQQVLIEVGEASAEGGNLFGVGPALLRLPYRVRLRGP